MKRVLNNEKGTTLLELVVSLSIVLIIAVGVSGMIFNAINYQQLTEKRQNATELGQMILEEFSAINEISSSNIQLLTLGKLNRINDEDFIYQGSYDNYQVTLELEKAEIFENKQSDIIFNLKSNQLCIDETCHSLETQENKIVVTKQENKYVAKIGTIEQESEEPFVLLNVLDNSFKGILKLENSTSNNGEPDWITVDVRGVEDSSENLRVEPGPKIRVRHIYSNDQLNNNNIEDFYHVAVTVSLDNKDLFKTYSNKFLTLREEE